MIIRLTHNAERILRHSQQVPAAMMKGMAAALDLENEYTLAYAQEKKLSGPTTDATLSVRTNRLRSSMRRSQTDNVFSAAQADGGRIFSTIGSNVRYAGVLEEGFTGEVSVKGHRRSRTVVEEFLRLGKRRKLKVKKRDVEVWGHTRQVNITGRHYLRRSVEEREGDYRDALSAAVVKAWNGGKP